MSPVLQAVVEIAERQTDTEIRIRETLATRRPLAQRLDEFGRV